MSFLKKLFKPNDISDCFRPILYIGKILLIYPYTIASDKSLQVSKRFAVVTTALPFLILIIFDVRQYIKTNGVTHVHDPFWTLSLLHLIGVNANVLVFAVTQPVNHKKLVSVHRKLHNFAKDHLKKDNIHQIYRISIIEMVFFILSTCLDFTFPLTSKKISWEMMADGLMFSWLSTFIAFCDLNFLNGIALTEKMVGMIQRNLIEISKPIKSASSISLEKRCSVITKDAKLDTIKKMRVSYRYVLEIKEDINDIFSIQMLSSVTNIFLESIFYVFLSIVAFQTNKHDGYDFAFFLGMGVYLFTKIFIIATVCYRLTSKLQKTGKILYDLMMESGEPEKEELKMFAEELVHRDASITASGFFDIDYGLLRHIIGAVFMYIIILFQFKFTEEPLEGSNNLGPVERLMYYAM